MVDSENLCKYLFVYLGRKISDILLFRHSIPISSEKIQCAIIQYPFFKRCLLIFVCDNVCDNDCN